MKGQNFLVASLSLFFEGRYPLASALTYLEDGKLITLACDYVVTQTVYDGPLGDFFQFTAWFET